MRLSFDWLRDYVDLSGLSAEDVAEKLTMGAFEVEEIRQVGPDIKGPVVVGEIVEINPLPNADKIRLTRINFGPEKDLVDIVCGADNIIVGQRVPVALPGARVINRHDGKVLEIKPTKIRGFTSDGMLCSAPELGITCGESEGIYILYGGPPLGTDVKKLLRLYPDYILHVEPRSNRGDALCVRGLAREVAALCGRPFREPAWALPEEEITSDSVEVEIENTADCPYFSLRTLEGVRVAPSPLRIARRLEAIGVRPVNNVVDITNYVLHELGQPLHAYDLAKLMTREMQVRMARAGELLTTLDGRERELDEEILVIAEGLRVLGVAGVMGGQETEIGDDTTFVVLEAAAFNPARVRRSSRRLGLSSDSSLRFERGVDLAGVRRASDRAAALILESTGGYLGRIRHGGSNEVKPQAVTLRLSQLKRLAELELGADQVKQLLEPLGFASVAQSADLVEVTVPSFRQRDVIREIDVVEEVLRLWGYDRIPASMPRTAQAAQRRDPVEQLAREALTACGLCEACISSLVGADHPELLDSGGPPGSSLVKVLNPLSEDHQLLRQSLLPGLIRAAAYNHDHGRKDVWLYEIGRVYARRGASSRKESGVHEELNVAGILSGQPARGLWQERSHHQQADSAGGQPVDLYTAKGVVENLLDKLSVPNSLWHFARPGKIRPGFHPGRACQLCIEGQPGAQVLGWLGEIHPDLAHASGLRQSCYLFEFSLDALGRLRQDRKFQEIFPTPAVVRDLTVDLDPSVEHQSVSRCIAASAGENLRQLELVSLFKLTSDKQSLSYRLTFQSPKQTLTNELVEENIQAVRERLAQELSAVFRT